MEGLVDLLPLLAVAAYYLLRARRRAGQRQQANPRTPPEARTISEPKGPTPFQQFMQQIEDAVAEASGETLEVDHPPEPPNAIPTPLPAPPAKPVRPAPEFHSAQGSFDAPAPVDHVRHGFGADNPLSEETFEQRPAQSLAPLHKGPLPDPHGLQERRASDPAPIPGVPHWRAKLRDPKAAREAFVLQTIFGARGGRRTDQR